jgi:hypothetical protein
MPGDRILVREPEWHETLTIDAATLPGGSIILEGRTAKAGQLVAWRPGPNHPKGQPLLQIRGVSKLRIEGFALDGQDTCVDLVRLAGLCPGLVLDRLELLGFVRTAVSLKELLGEERNPVVLTRSRFRGSPSSVAIRFESLAHGANRFVQIRDCRLDGPGRAAFMLTGSVSDVLVEDNRVAGFDAFLVYPSAHPQPNVHLQVVHNTAFDLGTFLAFEAEPPMPSAGPWVVENNLLVKVPRPLRLGSDPLPNRLAILKREAWNGCDHPEGDGAALLGCRPVTTSDLVTQLDNLSFLRYPRSSPLSRAAPGDRPVGAPPEE